MKRRQNTDSTVKKYSKSDLPPIDPKTLPVEIVEKIFSYLDKVQELLNCSEVCLYWNSVVEEASDKLWKEICAREFKGIYEESQWKSGLTWRELAKTLASWSDVKSAQVQIKSLPNIIKIRNFCFLKNNVFSYSLLADDCLIEEDDFMVYNTVVYYDLRTMAEIKRNTYNMKFETYSENEDVIVISYTGLFQRNCSLRIIPKENETKYKQLTAALDTFFLRGKEFFYITKNYENGTNNLYKIQIVTNGNDIEYKDSFVTNDLSGNVRDLQYINGKLHVFLTNNNFNAINIVCIENNETNLIYHKDLLHEPKIEVCNILIRQGIYKQNRDISFSNYASLNCGEFDDESVTVHSISSLMVYGRCVIAGCNSTLQIKIFDYPYDSDGNLDLDNSAPVTVIDLDRGIQIDSIDLINVVETTDGHKIIVVVYETLFVIHLRNVNLTVVQ